MKRYLKIWKQLATISFGSFMSNKIDFLTYFLGKVVRLGFFLILIAAIFSHTKSLAGYNNGQILFFMLTYNLLDTIGQAFFRGVYSFYKDVRNGNFDFLLSKPVNTLFIILNRFSDVYDFLFLIPLFYLFIYTVIKFNIIISLYSFFLFLLFFIASFLIIAGIHIISLAITVRSSEGENFIWIYRESVALGRFPPEIFPTFIKLFFTYFVPVIIIVSYPTKALLGLINFSTLIFAILYSVLFFSLSLLIWKNSIRHYSSASS